MSDTETAKTKRRIRKAPKRASAYRPGAAYMTRAQIPDYIEQTRGFKPALSSLNKLAMQGRLVPDKWYGNIGLHTPESVERLADDLVSTGRTNLRIDPDSTPNEAA
jgi:hypothetical protein